MITTTTCMTEEGEPKVAKFHENMSDLRTDMRLQAILMMERLNDRSNNRRAVVRELPDYSGYAVYASDTDESSYGMVFFN